MSGLLLLLLFLVGFSIVVWAVLDTLDRKRREKEDGTREQLGVNPSTAG